jgi:hypothetical protein
VVANSAFLAAAAALAGGLCPWGEARAAEESELDKRVAQLVVNELFAGVILGERETSSACAFGMVAFDHESATGRVWYATLLEALGSGASVDVVFERSAERCQLRQIHIR